MDAAARSSLAGLAARAVSDSVVEVKFDRAYAEFDRAEQGLPGSAEVLTARADALMVLDRFEEALEGYRSAFELSPHEADLPTEMACMLWVLRRYPEAMEAADRSIELAPDATWPYLYKTFIHWSWDGDLAASRAALESLPVRQRVGALELVLAGDVRRALPGSARPARGDP